MDFGHPVALVRADPVELTRSCRCGARWGITLDAKHCLKCHVTFTGLRTFDIHNRGGVCHEPSTVGMVAIEGRRYVCWGYPGEVG